MRAVVLVAAALWLAGCSSGRPTPRDVAPGQEAQATLAVPPPPRSHPPDPVDVLPPEPPAPVPREPVHVFEKGRTVRIVEHLRAAQDGYTVVSLANGWAPYLLRDCTPGVEECRPNAYRATFVALANERDPPEGASNPEGRYLELFGIPPSLSVLRKRILDDEAKECVPRLTYDGLREFTGFLTYMPTGNAAWIRQQADSARVAAARVAKKRGLDGPEALREVAEARGAYEEYRRAAVRMSALEEAQDRITCEGLVPHAAKMRRGSFDWPTHQGLAVFERKNRIFGWGFVGRDTIDDLRRTPLEGHYQTFIRVLEERIVDAAGILEDGSIRELRDAPTEFRTADGGTEPIRNLVEEYRNVALEAMGLATPAAFHDWITRLTDEELETFEIAVRFPDPPSYYGPTMDLSVEIDRGDVWYDFPWDAEGDPIPQPVTRRPKLTLYVTYAGERIPLVRYGTTVGGWRSERINGEDYYSYKNSDIGPRFWRQIFTAPVWIPPDSTPLSGLITKGRRRRVNYDEFGPGYASAYGLVAGLNVQEIPRDDGTTGWFDNGIRVHGSVDYMSIMQRHSHGCHRLYNHLALRLFDFVIHHRAHTRAGQTVVNYSRNFEVEGRPYRIELGTRGYLFQLDPPLPVAVLPGRILGTTQLPPRHPVRKPGVQYSGDTIDPVTGAVIPAPLPDPDAPAEPVPPVPAAPATVPAPPASTTPTVTAPPAPAATP
jgi:hypothetical protein